MHAAGAAGGAYGLQVRPAALVPADFEYSQTQIVETAEGELAERRIIAGGRDAGPADAFRILRTQVLRKLNGERQNTIGITSARPGEGKTLVAVNLAVSVALHMTRTVLLIDLDLRQNAVKSYFGLSDRPGVTDYLLGEQPLASFLINPGIERLVLLPAGSSTEESSELISCPKMIALAAEIRTCYADRLIIYDLPPVLVTDDAIAFLNYIDGCLLVCRDRVTEQKELQRTIELLNGFLVLGIVFNDSSNKDYWMSGNRQSNYTGFIRTREVQADAISALRVI